MRLAFTLTASAIVAGVVACGPGNSHQSPVAHTILPSDIPQTAPPVQYAPSPSTTRVCNYQLVIPSFPVMQPGTNAQQNELEYGNPYGPGDGYQPIPETVCTDEPVSNP